MPSYLLKNEPVKVTIHPNRLIFSLFDYTFYFTLSEEGNIPQ